MSRWDALEALGLSPEDLVELYNNSLDLHTLSNDLGVTVRTLKKHLKSAGIDGPYKYPPKKRKRHISQMAQWIRNNPHVHLPPSVPEICKITGLNRFIVHHYLYRRQDKYLKYVLRKWTLFLKEHKTGHIFQLGEKVIPLPAIVQTYISIDKFTLKIKAQFQLRDGTRRTLHINADYFNKIVK
jgi:hypothetical protein